MGYWTPKALMIGLFGGRERTRVVLGLSSVLALNTADGAMLGALAGRLERALAIDHTRFGFIVAAASATGVISAPLAGTLADRSRRRRLLTAMIVVWGLAMTTAGFASGYWWLLLSHVALGAALAAAGPIVTSMVGDFFHPSERARTYGWLLIGELVGAGVGLLTGGILGTLISWRVAFFALGAGSLLLAAFVHRMLPEPGRGGAGRLPIERSTHRDSPKGIKGIVRRRLVATSTPDERTNAGQLFAEQGLEPAASRVLRTPAQELSLPRATVYLMSIPSMRRLIIASAVGYFFFAGLRTFAVVFATRFYGLPEVALILPIVVIGSVALLGTLSGGRLADALLRRGSRNARLMVAAGGYFVAAVGFAPGFLITLAPLALALFALGGAGLAAANPPLDAARLDIVTGRLWGRAESLRTVTRLAAEALAPVLFGLTADFLGGRAGPGTGLRNAFLIMLVPLVINAVLVLSCRRTYATDTVTATASDRAGHVPG